MTRRISLTLKEAAAEPLVAPPADSQPAANSNEAGGVDSDSDSDVTSSSTRGRTLAIQSDPISHFVAARL